MDTRKGTSPPFCCTSNKCLDRLLQGSHWAERESQRRESTNRVGKRRKRVGKLGGCPGRLLLGMHDEVVGVTVRS